MFWRVGCTNQVEISNSRTTLHKALCVAERVRKTHPDRLLGIMDIIDYFLPISIIISMVTVFLGAAHKYDG